MMTREMLGRLSFVFLVVVCLVFSGMSFAEGAGPAKRTPVVSVKASSCESDDFSSKKAVDGDLQTRWGSEWSDPQWLMLDLGEKKTVDKVILHWEDAYAEEYEIQASEDGKIWYTLHKTTGGDGKIDEISFDPVKVQYLKIYGVKRAAGWGYSLYEVKVFSSSGVPTPISGFEEIVMPAKMGAKTSSCQEPEGYEPERAVDGNMSTRWSSSFSDPQWLEIDLGKTLQLVGLTIHWEAAYGKIYDILLSEDGKDWKEVYTATDGDGSIDDIYFKKTLARFLKILGKERGTAWGYSIYEVSIKEPGEEPVISASFSEAESEPGNILDGDVETKWRSGDKVSQWIKIDLRRVKKIGGIFLYWDKNFAKSYEIDVSSDDEEWKTVYSTDGANGGSDRIYFKKSPARFVKIKLPDTVKNGYALKEVVIKGPNECMTPQKHFEILAEDMPRGYFSRWLYNEQAFWTVIGVEEDFEESLLCEDGSFEPYRQGFTFTPFLHLDGKLITWADTELTQSLDKGYLPIPSVNWDCRDISMDVKSFAYGEPGNSSSYVKYTIENKSDKVIDGNFFLVVRPIQINPVWQPGGGLSKINNIEYLEDDSVVTVNKERKIYPLTKPDAFGACCSADKNIMTVIETGQVPLEDSVADSKGYASGAIKYSFKLEPKQSKDYLFVFPLHNQVPALNIEMRKGKIETAFEKMLKETISFWENRLDRIEIDIPDPEIINTLKTNVAYILINRDGFAIQPGSRTYESAWIRDGSMTCAALLRMGITKEVKEYIDWYSGFLLKNGEVPAIINHASEASGGGFNVNPIKEYDSQGQLIFLILQYYYFTKDKKFLEEKLPVVVKALERLEYLRDQRIADEYKNGPIEKRKFYGILPNSVSHEGYFPEPGMHSYWDDFFGLKGWKDAREIALMLGRDSLLEWIDREEKELRGSVYDSINLTIEHKNIDYIPGCAEKGDFDATSTAIAVMVCDELDSLPQPQLKNTFDRYYEEDLAKRFKPGWKGGFTPYEVRSCQAFLYMGQKERAWTLLRYLLDCRRPLNWNHLAEVVFSNPRLAQYIGDMPHTWVGSGYINAVRSFFVYEKDGRLILGRGVIEDWLSDGISVKNLPTYYGNINYTIKKESEDALKVKIWGDVLPPNGFIFKSPVAGKIKGVKLNGEKWVYFMEDNIMLDKLPAEINICFF